MIRDPRITVFDIVGCVSEAMDLVSPELVHHHQRAASVTASIAEELGKSREEQGDLVLAALLHGIGAVSQQPVEQTKGWR